MEGFLYLLMEGIQNYFFTHFFSFRKKEKSTGSFHQFDEVRLQVVKPIFFVLALCGGIKTAKWQNVQTRGTISIRFV